MIVISRQSVGAKVCADIESKRKNGRVPEYVVVTKYELDELVDDPLRFVPWNYYAMRDEDARTMVMRDFPPTSGPALAEHKVRMNQYVRVAESGRILGVPVYAVPLSHHPKTDNV